MGFADFFNGLFGGLGSLLGQVLQFLTYLVQVLAVVFQFLWQALLAVFNYGLRAVTSIGSFLQHVWVSFAKNVIGKIVSVLKTAHRWLEQRLLPIIRWLQRARALLDRWYRLYLRPYLQLIQRLRGYLQILRLLHIRWAEALDRRLARTEANIAHQFLLIRSTLNDVINFVNGIANPHRLSRMVLVSIAGRRTAAAVVRAVTGLPLGFFFPHTGKGSLPFEQPVTKASDLRDPRRNPPVSDLLGGALLPLSDGFDSSDPAPDLGELDGLETVPYFDAIANDLFAVDAFFDGLEPRVISIRETIEHGSGNLSLAGKSLATFLEKL